MIPTKKPKYGDAVFRNGVKGMIVSGHHRNGCLIEWSDGKHEFVSLSALDYKGSGRFEL